jgi:hypothetical protein
MIGAWGDQGPGGAGQIYVPEGLGDRSQVIYCLEQFNRESVPEGTV